MTADKTSLRRRSVALMAGLALALALAPPPAATAAAATDPPAAAPATGPPAPARLTVPAATGAELSDAIPVDGAHLDLPAGMYPVTLITGDRVTLLVSGRGDAAVDLAPVARADGTTPSIRVTSTPDGILAIPEDVPPLLAADRLDESLFDVSYLAAHYPDPVSTTLPVIVQYRQPAGAASLADTAAATPAAADGTVTAIRSVNGAAVELVRSELGTFWEQLRGESAPAAAVRGIDKVWLDYQVTVTMDQSVPLIGAPEAWAAGYDGGGVRVAVLDTGIDESHPDLAGAVVASHSFVGDTVTDGHGHGTHVASTIVGSGAASDGSYRGVAPAADLIVAKVLGDGGRGNLTTTIQGIEWAAVDQRADIINLSIACGCPGAGAVFLDETVDRLTAETGALFVVAAGNDGPDARTVTSPGTADAALTVAATTRADELAEFSSRGPRDRDHALKPDIAGPGVGIVASRATGTAMGSPVDDHYTAASGTSMATPHVAGAAALLAQQYPDWTPAQLKAGLMSTATDTGASVFGQGAGRVDVGRAATQRVFARTPQLDFGNVLPDDPQRRRTVTYANAGDAEVTLELTATVGSDAGPLPPGALTVQPASLTVPAGGTAEATVTLVAPSDGAGVYGGRLAAVGADGSQATTPIAFTQFSELEVTVDPRRDGADPGPVESCGHIRIFRLAGTGDGMSEKDAYCVTQARQTSRFLVPAGEYFVEATTGWEVDGQRQVAHLFAQDVTVTPTTTVRLAADDARPTTPRTPRPAEPDQTWLGYQRTTQEGRLLLVRQSYHHPETGLWLTSTPAARTGQFAISPYFVLGAPAPADTAIGARDYVYLFKPYLDRVPSGFAISRADVAPVRNVVHSDVGEQREAALRWYVAHPDYPELTMHRALLGVPMPGVTTLYMGPTGSGAGFLGGLEVRQASGTYTRVETGLYNLSQRRPRTINWAQRPAAPGPVAAPAGVGRSLAGFLIPLGDAYQVVSCSGCREGNQFNPLIVITTPDRAHGAAHVGGVPFLEAPERALDGVHLYDDAGDEIPGYVHYPCDGEHHDPCQVIIGGR